MYNEHTLESLKQLILLNIQKRLKNSWLDALQVWNYVHLVENASSGSKTESQLNICI